MKSHFAVNAFIIWNPLNQSDLVWPEWNVLPICYSFGAMSTLSHAFRVTVVDNRVFLRSVVPVNPFWCLLCVHNHLELAQLHYLPIWHLGSPAAGNSWATLGVPMWVLKYKILVTRKWVGMNRCYNHCVFRIESAPETIINDHLGVTIHYYNDIVIDSLTYKDQDRKRGIDIFLPCCPDRYCAHLWACMYPISPVAGERAMKSVSFVDSKWCITWFLA